jgi:hypothetical protein
MTRSERKDLRREEALERATSRESFLNKHGRNGYVQLLEHLNMQFPTGAKKERAKLVKVIKSIKA